jgi:hypothetical protein
MTKKLFFLSCLVFAVTIVSAQTKTKTTPKQTVPELKKLLTGSNLPFKMVNDSLAVIPYEGENIESYKVVVQKISDLYIVYTNLSEALPEKIDETRYKYLLQKNDHYDVVKIGMSESDGTVYLRADLYRAGTTNVLLKRVIVQVANVTNIIGGDLK